jgi:diaminopimelate epimerase
MEFTKMHGAANDFVVVDARNMMRDWPGMAITVCDRHTGIGCDSLIILLNSDKADFGMRTFDTDGSESETCGNGLRCVARYVLEKDLIEPDIQEVTIETQSGVSSVKMERENGKVVKFWANLGKPRLTAEQFPVRFNGHKSNCRDINGMIAYKDELGGRELLLNLVSMGNPHAVCFLKEPVKEFPMSSIGPMVENLPIFLNRTNFEVVRILDKEHVEARVWERGVGETMACGSGTCAITVAAKLSGYTGSKIQVQLPGGTLDGTFNGNGEVVLGGPAVIVYEGTWPE